jgi:hypothetical protein
MYDSRATNNGMWSLCDRKTPAQVDTTSLTADPTNAFAIPTPSTMSWVPIQLGQISESPVFGSEVALGYPIQNSVVNLTVTFPSSGSYQLSAAYHYASSLVFTKNTAEYVF